MTWPHVNGRPCDCASCTSSASPPLRPCSECLRALPPGAHWPACSRAPAPEVSPLVVDGWVTGVRLAGQHLVRSWLGSPIGRTRGVAVVDVELALHPDLDRQTLSVPVDERVIDTLTRRITANGRTPRVRVTVEVVP